MQYPPTKTQPWTHQQQLWDVSKNKPYFYIAHDMGCGKSKGAIDYANAVDAESILVLCPKFAVGVWPKQFKLHSKKQYQILAPEKGSAAKKADLIDQHIIRCQTAKVPYVIVLNYEITIRPPLGPTYNRVTNRMVHPGRLLQHNWHLLNADEAHRLKSPGGKASWNVARIGKNAEHRRFLSGTMMPHSPLDVYAQYRALDNTVFGTRFDYFRHQYCIMGGYENKQVVRFVNLDDLNARVFSIAHYVKSEDVLDLPEESDRFIECELSPKARKIYNELNKEFIAMVDDQEITAQNALVKLLRLGQIAGGYLKLDDGTNQVIDNTKIDTTVELLSDLPLKEPVIIFCRFENEINRLAQQINSKIVQRNIGFICGFKDPPADFYDSKWHATDTDTLIVQVQAGSEGVDFTVSHYCIFLSKDFSLGRYRQGKKRLHRPGQQHKTFFYHILANGTVDQKIMEAIAKRKQIVDYILEDLNPSYRKN